jgi:hypothetical protein
VFECEGGKAKVKHDVQDGRDAAARAQPRASTRPRPIRYDIDTWIVMRDDPVLPAAIITRLRNPNRSECYISVTWDLEPANRRLIGRYPSLQEADAAVRYAVAAPVVGAPAENTRELRKRQDEQALQAERERSERARLYGP